ncbi:glycosyltransferase family 4 protein [Candidatus Peregrinibacteria bacterium HGW-Peregrinibacteria-1]|jgi:glycosyltransferase involved in cell wall biosynthesis|nr:MAG: glycosyltransferase family 4 protein [Candidatus Peregrinibacteria bacterium HGW-Peregrinibacteria-1]
MKVAIVHDFLVKLGGAERVLENLMRMFPEAPIYTMFYDHERVGDVFPMEKIRTSRLQKLPKFLRKRYRYFLGWLPRVIEEFDFSEFDVVISSNTAFAHGIITGIDTKHVCYCHSPMRYAWDWANEYKSENGISGLKLWFYQRILKKIRMWDMVAADRPDLYVANSNNVARRIKKYYRQESEVVYPPVDVDRFQISKNSEDYFLIVSTLTPYKKIDLAVELFSRLGKRLVVIGDGPHRFYLEGIANENVEFLGFKEDEMVVEYMQNCRALIFPGEEDFGITPVEAMAAGKPVLAYGKGGVLETVIEGETGEFFYEPTVKAMEDGLARLIYNSKYYDAGRIRKRAEEFSSDVFVEKMKTILGK